MGANSPWSKALRLKKSIISVSRAWYDAGVSLLYEDTCIRRIAQNFDLLQTLKLSAKLGSLKLVRSFEIQCYVPLNISEEFNLCLNFVLDRFPRLSTFTFSSPCGLPSSALVLPPLTDITHLRLSAAHLGYSAVIGVLNHVKSSMRSLQLSLGDDQLEVTDEIARQDVTLPALETLALATSTMILQLGYITAHWKMPSLRRLTFSSLSVVSGGLQTNPLPLLRLLEGHGSHLTFLHISICRFTLTGALLSHMADHCPRLEYLIIYPGIFSRASWRDDSLLHSNVRWLFVWGSNRSSLPTMTAKALRMSDSPSGFSKQKFPALRGVHRILDLPRALIDWPECFEACLTSTDPSPFTIDAFQTQLRSTADCISWIQPEWKYDVDEEYEGNPDGFNTDSEIEYVSADSEQDEEVEEYGYVQITRTPEEEGWSEESTDSSYSYASASDTETSDGSGTYSDDEEFDTERNARMDLAPAYFSPVLANVEDST